jgi:hypothetical protein
VPFFIRVLTTNGVPLHNRYHDYIFPDEEAAGPNLKLLNMAKMWKKKQELMKLSGNAPAAAAPASGEADTDPDPADEAAAAPVPTASEDGAAFITSDKFAGSKPGYAFKSGEKGVGYYIDETTQ